MANITITGVDLDIRKLSQELKKTIQELADEVFVDVKANTPVRSGNARSKWTKKVTENNFQVTNRVPYIERLEAGASKQAPNGIIGPTLSQIKGKV
jgi:hypothetical protein